MTVAAKTLKKKSKKLLTAKGAAAALEAVDYVYHKSFTNRGTEDGLWGADDPLISVPDYHITNDVGDDVSPDASSKRAKLTPDQEKTLFLQYNFAKYRLAKLIEKEGNNSPAVREWRARSELALERLVQANLRLVPSMAGRVRMPGVEFPDLLSEGYAAVLRSVEKFDVSRGLKFSTYACRAIFASFHRLGRTAQSYRKRFPAQYDPELEQSDQAERRHEQQREDAMHALRTVLQQNLADLGEVERTILQQRYLESIGRAPCTVRDVAEKLSLSTERVRRIEKASLAKLRRALNEYLG